MKPAILSLALALAAGAESLRVGPVYTKDFPDFDIVVEATTATSNTTLKAADITLVEDGTPANVATNLRRFREMGQGVAVALVIDVSGSMRGRPMQAIREGLAGFVSRARDYDQVAIASVADETRWEVEWTTPRADIKQRLVQLEARGSLTRLWDGLEEALTMLDRPELVARRRLVVISDGHDEGSRTTLAEVMAHAIRLRIPIDCIGITRSNPAYLRTLELLARNTHGTFRYADDTEALKDRIANGIELLLDTPVATFRAKTLTGDGKLHDVGVRWDSAGLTDQERVTLPKLTWQWFRWWHGAIAGTVALFALALVFRRRKPASLLPPPTDPIRPPAPVRPDPDYLPPGPIYVPGPIFKPTEPARHRTQLAIAFAPPTPERPTAYLRGLDGPAAGWRVPIDRGEFWIGAESNNACKLELDETVSANHACIRFEGSSLRIYDNRSTNKTWHNRQPLTDAAALLAPGDQIRIGRSTFALETDS
jgi:Mg-chelatase subunit ChlD